jgi:hypothetical protein
LAAGVELAVDVDPEGLADDEAEDDPLVDDSLEDEDEDEDAAALSPDFSAGFAGASLEDADDAAEALRPSASRLSLR